MTHFVGLVVADTPEEVARLLAPYDEDLEVEEHFEEVDLARMAGHYGTDRREELLEKMEDWTGCPGRLHDDGKLGYVTTRNPHAKWDWYVVGGRWSGAVPGDHCPGREVRDHFREYLPGVLVDGAGWHASSEYGWFGTSRETSDPGAVARKLEEHADRTVYVVDFHGA